MTKVHEEHLLWCDLETTGLSEHWDKLVEVACVLTTAQLVEVAQLDVVLHVHRNVWEQVPDVVKDMHESNGLQRLSEQSIVTVEQADAVVYAWLLSRPELPWPLQIRLAGSGVSHFDKRWIDAKLPLFSSLLTHATIDVGVVRRFLSTCRGMRGLDGLFVDSKSHRGIEDVLGHIEEGRYYAGQRS